MAAASDRYIEATNAMRDLRAGGIPIAPFVTAELWDTVAVVAGRVCKAARMAVLPSVKRTFTSSRSCSAIATARRVVSSRSCLIVEKSMMMRKG